MKRIFTLIILSLLIMESSLGQADTIRLNGPSFEQEPHIGNHYNTSVKHWFDCGVINFPTESPPDIHPVNYWGVVKIANDGWTYLGLVTRDNDSYETISQKLSSRLLAGESYKLSVYLAQSDKYLSRSRLETRDTNMHNYINPVVFRLWGGYGYCDDKELLAVTNPIDHEEWTKYELVLKPTIDISSITIEAFYEIPITKPYNGHILVDNLSDIIKITNKSPSDSDANHKKEVKKKLPPHLRQKKK